MCCRRPSIARCATDAPAHSYETRTSTDTGQRTRDRLEISANDHGAKTHNFLLECDWRFAKDGMGREVRRHVALERSHDMSSPCRFARHARAASAVASLVIALLVGVAAAQAQRFEIIDLDDVRSTSWAIPIAINDDGVIVGTSDLARPAFDEIATVWSNARARTLGLLPGDHISSAVALLPDRSIAVGSSTFLVESGEITTHFARPVVFHQGQVIDIRDLAQEPLDFMSMYASAVTPDGRIAGWGFNAVWNRRAWLFENGSFRIIHQSGWTDTEILDMNDARQVLGNVTPTGSQRKPFVWVDGEVTLLSPPEGRFGEGLAMDQAGRVVGYAQISNRNRHAVRWEADGSMTVLGSLGGNISVAYGTNERGQVVGQSNDENLDTHMFLWQDGAMINPLDALPPGHPFVGRSTAFDINEAGQIVGTAWRSGQGDNPVVITPVDLLLSDISPGVAGQLNSFQVDGLQPNQSVDVFFGRRIGMTRAPGPGCPGATLLISSPKLAATATADSRGSARMGGVVPPGWAGRTVRIQASATDGCTVSNVTTVTFR